MMGQYSEMEKRYMAVRFSDIMEKDWDEFVNENSTGYVYHLYQVMMVDEEADSINISFAIIDRLDGKIVLLMPLFLRKGKTEHGRFAEKNELIARYGIVVKDGLTKKTRNHLSEFYVTYMDGLLELYGVSKLETEVPSLCSYNLPGKNQIVNYLIFFGFAPRIRYTWVVDLRKEEPRILKDCGETTRQAIRKYQSSEEYVFVETGFQTVTADLETFVSLSEITYGRTSGKAKSREYYRHIFLNLDNSKRRVFFMKRKSDGQPMVSAVLFIYHNTAHYSLGASVSDKPSGLSKYFIYCIMLELKRSGIVFFETGGAYPYLRKGRKEKGISDFKKCFGTFLHPIDMGEFMAQ